MDFTLVIGSKHVSSWSLRPWLVMKHFQITFREHLIPLDRPDTTETIQRHSPSGRVPLLTDGDLKIWDSLAICEYLAERFPEKAMWPKDRGVRAVARAVSSEMHSSFASMRKQLSMDLLHRFPTPDLLPETFADVSRIQEIWKMCLTQYQGPFLFGDFSIADAMYAPVVTRFQTYSIETDRTLKAYQDRILALPAMKEWTAAAQNEV